MKLFLFLFLFILILILIYYYLINIYCNTSIDYFIYKSPDFNELEDKTIMIISGTHGNEPAGYYAISDLINNLKNQKLKLQKCKFILVPGVNYCALKLNMRSVPLIGDLNRKYPVDINDITCNKINKKIIDLGKDADFILDFHEGWGFHRQNSKSIGSTLTTTNTELSQNLSFLIVDNLNKTINLEYKKFKVLTNDENLIKENSYIYGKNENIKGTLLYYETIMNKNYILVETTGQNNIQPLKIRINQINFIIDYILKYFNCKKIDF